MVKTTAGPASVSAPPPPTAAAAKKRGRKVEREERKELRNGEVLGRDGEVLSRARSTGYRNEFDIPEQFRDPEWDMQWVRTSCHGKPDEANVNAHMENGWRPVPADRLRSLFRTSTDKQHIERDGLILCERPMKLTREALAEERRNAVELKQAQAEQFGARKLPEGFEEGGVSGDGRYDARRKIRRTIEGAPSALLPERQIAVDDND